jgi:lysozyme
MKKTVVRKTPSKRKSNSKKKTLFLKTKAAPFFIGLLSLLFLLAVGYHYRNGLAYYLGFKTDKIRAGRAEKRISDVRNFQLLNKYRDKVAGIDVSQYQGKINWEQVQKVENNFRIGYVFVRATAGTDKVDAQFDNNWRETKKRGIIRGAYHYYRPNENSLKQADHFIATVHLHKGDLPPVLDIESLPKKQSLERLKVGLRRWLEKVHHHYKIKPIIYTGEQYYNDFLKEDFNDYPFWIANYNFFTEDLQEDWLFWQFTEEATVSGIKENVDVNIYNGTPKMLNYLTLSR